MIKQFKEGNKESTKKRDIKESVKMEEYRTPLEELELEVEKMPKVEVKLEEGELEEGEF